MYVVGYKEIVFFVLFCKYIKDMIIKFKFKIINICIKSIYSYVYLYMYMFEYIGYLGICLCNY